MDGLMLPIFPQSQYLAGECTVEAQFAWRILNMIRHKYYPYLQASLQGHGEHLC
jgi:hypothetical protein